jgi:hypothetical protein
MIFDVKKKMNAIRAHGAVPKSLGPPSGRKISTQRQQNEVWNAMHNDRFVISSDRCAAVERVERNFSHNQVAAPSAAHARLFSTPCIYNGNCENLRGSLMYGGFR